MEIGDLVGLSKPLTKLLEIIESGVGKWYAPWHIKRIAKANAYEIKIMSDTLKGIDNIIVGYNNGNLSISNKELLERTSNRLLNQEKYRKHY